MMNETLYFVLSGPSGVGKTTLIKKLTEMVDDLGCPVSNTSRSPREEEIEGVHYYFKSPEAMMKLKMYDKFAELTTREDGTQYGLTQMELRRMRRFKSAIFDLDVAGARAIKELLGDAVTLIMVVPEYGDELYTRLEHRGTEEPQEISKRLERGVQELMASGEYDYLVINRSVDEAAKQIQAIIQAEHLSIKRKCNEEQILAVMDDLQGRI